jgi:hypothetical protein
MLKIGIAGEIYFPARISIGGRRDRFIAIIKDDILLVGPGLDHQGIGYAIRLHWDFHIAVGPDEQIGGIID